MVARALFCPAVISCLPAGRIRPSNAPLVLTDSSHEVFQGGSVGSARNGNLGDVKKRYAVNYGMLQWQKTAASFTCSIPNNVTGKNCLHHRCYNSYIFMRKTGSGFTYAEIDFPQLNILLQNNKLS